jgi:hypothetical protein
MFKKILILASFIIFSEVVHADNYGPNSASPIIAEAKISTGETITLISPNLEVTASRTATKDGWKIKFVGKSKGKLVFSLSDAFKNPAEYASSVKLVKLFPDSEYPQILFDAYTGGAHCCTMTEILLASNSGNWHFADFGYRDGDELKFEDTTGAGNYVVIGVDESFNYTFDCYACSRPPIKIEEFKNGQLNDVTREPRLRDRLKYELQRIESDPSTNWNSNGFLAGWVALKSLLGEQNDAFRRLLPLYDRTNQFGVMECVIPASIGKCPADKRKFIPFPEGLKKHLVSQKYLTSKEAARLPTGDAEVPQNENPVKDPATQKPVEPNELTPEIRIWSDEPLGLLSKQEICRYAVTSTHLGTVPAAWDDRPAYSEYLKEAKFRGYSLENCAQALVR